ncbi:MAG TPA: AAA family ATPase [Chloroflexia bacterium]|nr:AAA family ATPase [Chloroflexia bacterium]
MPHLATVIARQPASSALERFPFSVPAIRSLSSLELNPGVTFLVGENGSGKSTLLEALAIAAGLPTVGSVSADKDRTLASVRLFAEHLTLSWARRTHKGFFMRSEDFFGFAKQLAGTREEYEADLQRVDRESEDRSPLARALARSPYLNQLEEMKRRYGDDLDARSHGESYFTVFQSRFVPGGLYLLDEPEAPLSPLRQLSLISMLKTMVSEQNAQFLIATHSPILMAFPGALIYGFDGGHIERVNYDEVEHVTVTRSFLNNPEGFLRHL